MKNLIFVDCEASGPCPGKGELTEFGAVDFASRPTFHGVLFEPRPKADNPAPCEAGAGADTAPRAEVTGRAFDPEQVVADFERWLLSVGNRQCIFVTQD